MSPAGGWLSIGEFAGMSRLSVRTLRHYDREGLLAPGRVDPHTGYRYYSREQLAAALRIAVLRRAEVSVPAIRRLLQDPGHTEAVLAAERERIECEAARKYRALALVASLADAGADGLPVCRYRIEDRTVLWRNGESTAEALDTDVTNLVTALLADASSAGLPTDAPVVGQYPAALDGVVQFGVGLELRSPPGRVDTATTTLPGGTFAGVDFVGPVALLPVAYHALFGWLEERGLGAGGPFREYYLTDPRDVAPEAMRTRVLHPVPGDLVPE
ncbi:MerR family transcriptional regulator [Rhodococcus sp. GXMU-t2271]|uniref:MerR family transcriptional regulator n=1 Tax=Rhodococcus indonesiensis TaxID=3055869 RepID=A0ABT7RLW5_9NOCA|nr:MerR family transcriptional regulator [Rhodococcus indonesiensis]MDM7488635.1 MerR family transcriptional regulator [Rhodococcus indonesiensis]